MKTKKETLSADCADSADANQEIQPPAAQPWLETVTIPLAKLVPSPTNPRKKFDPAKQLELEASMREHGFSLSTLLVRPIQETLRIEPVAAFFVLIKEDGSPDGQSLNHFPTEEDAVAAMKAREDCFEVVAGERRYRAAKAVGVAEAPCIVRQLSDQQVLELQLVENIQRDDLTPIEEAEGIRRLLEARDGEGNPLHTIASLAAKVSKSLTYIERRVKLCRLEGEAREAVEAGTLAPRTAMLIASIPDAKLREKFAKEVLHPTMHEAPLTYARAEALSQQKFMRDLRSAPFNQKDADLVPVEMEGLFRVFGGACTDCPFRLGNTPEASEIPSAQHNMCMNPRCYGAKCEAGWDRWMTENTDLEKNRQALTPTECERLYQYGDQLDWNSGMVDLADRPDSNDLKPGREETATWRKMIKGSDLRVFAVRDRNGKTHDLVERKLAIEAARQNGHKNFKTTKGGDAEASGSDELAGFAPTEFVGAPLDEKEIARREREEKKEQFENEVQELTVIELAAALVSTAKKPPAGFWLFMVNNWDVYFDDGFEMAGQRRGFGEGWTIEEKVAEMTDAQQFGFYLEVYFFSACLGERAALLKLFEVDMKAVERRVREAAKAAAKMREDQEKAEKALMESFVVPELLWGMTAADYTVEQNIFTLPHRIEIVLPGKKAFAEVQIGRSEKGWHIGFEYQCAKANDGAEMSLPNQSETSYDTLDLALHSALLDARAWFKRHDQGEAIDEHLAGLVKLYGAGLPSEQPAKKGTKKKGAK